MHKKILSVIAPMMLAAGLLGGCTTTAQVDPNVPRSIEYPGGRYQLYGDGTTASPYYYVWIPAGTTPPPAPPLPSGVVSGSSSTSSQGRYQLYGDGTSAAPYYYVWVPAGTTTPPPPPPPPRRP